MVLLEEEEMKNNPFKLIGPYIGAVALPIILQFIGIKGLFCQSPLTDLLSNTVNGCSNYLIPLSGSSGGLLSIGASPPIFAIIIGFLLGWGIQYFIRGKK